MLLKINLKEIFNHKFIYEEISNNNLGLDGTYILDQDLNDIDCFNISKEELDNVVCNNQILQINNYVDKLHILGFSYWGSTNEYFEIKYQDGYESVKIPFVDWVMKSSVNYRTISWYGENIETIKQVTSKGILIHTVNFHHSITKLDPKKMIKEIIFPDNFLIHIFAITLEIPD